MALITARVRRLRDEIRQDPVAYEMLKAKCRWEAMGLFAVLLEWGDPRTWPAYVSSPCPSETKELR